MQFRTRISVFAAVTGLLVGGGALAASSASAGSFPSPSDTPTEIVTPVPTPTTLCALPTARQFFSPTNRTRCQQEDFAIQFSSFNRSPLGKVLGSGPIVARLGTDRSLSPTLELVSDGLGDSLLLRHRALAGAVIDRNDCTITIDQADQPVQFIGRTGAWRNVSGTGLYNLVGLFSFPSRGFRCTLPAGLTSLQADHDLNIGTGTVGGVSPLDFAVDVNGEAAVSLNRVRVRPVPSPSRSFFAPTDNPDNTDTATPVTVSGSHS